MKDKNGNIVAEKKTEIPFIRWVKDATITLPNASVIKILGVKLIPV
ncbi:hypothetical protein [uncultured Bacteroides sp.]|nr:hypothetical protein [uncultured Bacteroides sp.]